MGLTIGIDLGGTKIAAIIYDAAAGVTRGKIVVPTQAHEGPDAVLRRIGAVCRDLCVANGLTIGHIMGAGLGVPATFDPVRGCTLIMPNLPGEWYEKPCAPILSADLGCPVVLVNDARAFTLAEATLGAGRGAQTVVGITLGTGIGGGIAIGGRLHLGLGAAGEFGHITVDRHGLPDGTGNPGGWEALASGPAIAAMGIKYVAQGITTRIAELVGNDLNKITPEVILHAAEMGDAVAQDILRRAGEFLGVGMSIIMTILAPDCVVIGGGVAHLGGWIMQPIHEQLALRCQTVPLEQVRIVLAELGGDAGMIGAAIWASQQMVV